MGETTPNQTTDPLGRVTRLSRIGLWVSTGALIMAIGILVFLLWNMLTGQPDYIDILIEDLSLTKYVDTMSLPQVIASGLLWASVDILGVLMLWQVRALFRGFLHSGVFTESSALCLRRIGLIVLVMGPVSIVSGALAGALISFWQSGNSVHGSITIDDSDIYAIVIGLVITAVSHIMLEAARLNQENKAFV